MSFGDQVAEGPCELIRNSTGTVFTIPVDKTLNLTVLIYRIPGGVVSPSRGMGARATLWGKGETTERHELGAVTPLDACWVGDHIRICAWPLHQESEQPKPAAQ